jgi:3-hydroxyisobutyrate dehydrogenase
MAENTTVALLGTGIMGAAMARNLLGAGMEVRAWNRSTEKAGPLADDGATVVGDPTEAARGADFLLTMLADADAIEEVLRDGVLPALAEGAVWLQMSTVGERGHATLAHLAAENGVAYVDAPCWGRRRQPSRGQLVVLASGPKRSARGASPSSGPSGARRCGSARRGRAAASSSSSTTG